MRFVPVEIVSQQMSAFAPPAWCKLTLLGAVYSGRFMLYAKEGRLRAYLPAYSFHGQESPLPPLRKWKPWTQENLIDAYGLKDVEVPNLEPIEIWLEEWRNEPRSIALGWSFFVEPWDWDEPRLQFEGFDIPEDYSTLFGYDDLHNEGDPDIYLTYDAAFDGLALALEDAESLAPMVNFQQHSYAAKPNSPTKRIGRPKGSGWFDADKEIVERMISEKTENPSLSTRSLAEKYADEAAGHGTRESKAKRLERRVSGFF